jgi:tetratricopeptide (TPR) repeat protein
MHSITTLLKEYADDTENSKINMHIANYYYDNQQYAGALSLYLRAAERTDIPDIQYYSLIKAGRCLEVSGNRRHTVRTLFSHAINIYPNRPEAYFFMSRNHEWSQEWIPSYTYANLGLVLTNGEKDKSNIDINEYPGRQGLLFQKAIAAWWWGKCSESRDLHKELVSKYFNVLDQSYITAIGNNLNIIYKR